MEFSKVNTKIALSLIDDLQTQLQVMTNMRSDIAIDIQKKKDRIPSGTDAENLPEEDRDKVEALIQKIIEMEDRDTGLILHIQLVSKNIEDLKDQIINQSFDL